MILSTLVFEPKGGHILGLFYADNPRLCLYFSVIGVWCKNFMDIHGIFYAQKFQ